MSKKQFFFVIQKKYESEFTQYLRETIINADIRIRIFKLVFVDNEIVNVIVAETDRYNFVRHANTNTANPSSD